MKAQDVLNLLTRFPDRTCFSVAIQNQEEVEKLLQSPLVEKIEKKQHHNVGNTYLIYRTRQIKKSPKDISDYER